MNGQDIQSGWHMNPTQEFLRHASECEKMAKSTRDADSKATWSRMAERWQQCAEKYENETAAARAAVPTKRFRNFAPGWAREH
jgi:hypothetical protein